jgi:serine protease
VPTDPRYTSQWWLRAAGGTNANAIADRLRGVPGFLRAWQSGLPGATGRATAVVAVLDTGITPHPDLEGRILPGYDFVSETVYSNDGNGRDADPTDPGDWVSSTDRSDAAFKDCEVEDSSWHGTIISALVAAATDNGIGVAGINRDGRVLPVRVAGKCGAAVADIIDGMRWAAGLSVAGVPLNPNPARIINISFGGSAACGDAYLSAINELRAVGAIVIAAAGNEFGAPTRPASCSGAVGVVALNRDGFKTNYSNFGSVLSASGIATVGGDDSAGGWGDLLGDSGLFTAWNDGLRQVGTPGYSSMFGTSFSAPLVSGAASLMLSVNATLSAAQLIDGLRRSARPHVSSPRIGICSSANPGRCICTSETCGAGILDAEQALLFAASPASYVAPVRQAEVIDNTEVTQASARGLDRSGTTTPPPATDAGTGSSSSSGGGAMDGGWLAGLALVTSLLLVRRPRRG